MKQSLLPVRRRIRWLRFVQGLLLGLLSGLALCFLLRVVSFFVPVEGAGTYGAILLGGCTVLGALTGLLWPVPLATAAKRADQTGLKERSQTALALTPEDSPMAALQRADAVAALRAMDVPKAMPLRPDRRIWLTALCLMLALGVTLFIPNPQDGVIRARQDVRQNLRDQADAMERAAQSIAEQDQLTAEEAQELRRITAEMARELRTAGDKREALLGIDKHQDEMDKLQRNIQQRLSSQTAAALSSQPGLQGVAQAMEDGTETDLAQALGDLENEMMQSDAMMQALANQLVEAALKAPDGEIAQYLAQSGASAVSGNASESVKSLASGLAAAKGTGGSSSGAGSNVSSLLQSAKASTGSGEGKTINVTINLPAGGSGSGTGSGSGAGQGQGGGSGAGKGSTNQDMGYTPGMRQAGDGGGAIQDKVGTYERIYDPTRIGGTGDVEQVTGEERDGETQQISLGPGAGTFDGYIPYNEVIGEYQDAAAQAMQRQTLPSALQGFVNRYFDALVD